MRILHLLEALTMDEVAELMLTVDQSLTNLESAVVKIQPYLDEVGIEISVHGQPAVVYFGLINPNHTQFVKQLRGAFVSHFRRQPQVGEDIEQSLSGQRLRSHALKFLTNPSRWKRINWSYQGQTLPITPQPNTQSSSL